MVCLKHRINQQSQEETKMDWKKGLRNLFCKKNRNSIEWVNPSLKEVENFVENIISDKNKLLEDAKLKLLAEGENARKRFTKQINEANKYGSIEMVKDLLRFVDEFNLSHKKIKECFEAFDDNQFDSINEGLEIISKKLDDILSKHGIEKIECQYMQFNPNLHEAVKFLPNDNHQRMTITEELQAGYKMYDRVIRPSKVVVSSGCVELCNEEAE